MKEKCFQNVWLESSYIALKYLGNIVEMFDENI